MILDSGYNPVEKVKLIIRRWEIDTQARDFEGVTTVPTADIKIMIAYFKMLDRQSKEGM